MWSRGQHLLYSARTAIKSCPSPARFTPITRPKYFSDISFNFEYDVTATGNKIQPRVYGRTTAIALHVRPYVIESDGCHTYLGRCRCWAWWWGSDGGSYTRRSWSGGAGATSPSSVRPCADADATTRHLSRGASPWTVGETIGRYLCFCTLRTDSARILDDSN